MINLGKYIKIINKDGKTWIIPVNNLKNALNLYQPSAVKGRILKKWLPVLYPIPILSNILESILHIEPCDYEITDELGFEIEKAFGEKIDLLSFAFFLGTPSIHQKTTIQISNKHRILGYCKYTSDEQIKRIFHHEELILNKLNVAGVDNIPLCLFCGKTNSDNGTFIQSTSKTNNSIITHAISKKHIEFLRTVYEKTKTRCSFLNTDYKREIEDYSCLLMQSDFFSTDEKQQYCKALKKIDMYYSNQFEYCVFHADFTPWNMFEEKGKLFVFDWEYSKATFPPFIDLFHYFTQSEIFEYGKDADRITEDFEKEFSRQLYDGLFQDKDIAYLSYLVYIVGFYFNRDKGEYSKDIKHCMSIWMQLITYFYRRVLE